MKKLTKEEYYFLYLKVYSATRDSKSDKLSLPEIKVLVKLLVHNNGQSNLKLTSPYYGRGRKEILEALGMKTTTFSNTLAKLKKKGILIKLKNETDYALSIAFQKLQSYVNENRQVHIAYAFEIID